MPQSGRLVASSLTRSKACRVPSEGLFARYSSPAGKVISPSLLDEDLVRAKRQVPVAQESIVAC